MAKAFVIGELCYGLRLRWERANRTGATKLFSDVCLFGVVDDTALWAGDINHVRIPAGIILGQPRNSGA